MKNIIIPLGIVSGIVLLIILVLANNKEALNKANTPVDRSNVPVAVKVSNVEIQPLEINVNYPATLQPSDEVKLYAQASGIISSLNLGLGQKVGKGQVLGKLDTRILEINLQEASTSFKAASLNAAKLLDDYTRARDLYEHKAGLEVNMLAAKNSYENALSSQENAQQNIALIQQQIANSNIVAPVSGIVSAHNVKQGEFINPGTPLATITNINTLKATVFVDQNTAYQLSLGQLAQISSTLFKERKFQGKVIYISPVADINHNYQIDLMITDKGGIELKGGTDVHVAFQTIARKKVLQIPKSSLMTDASEPYVYVVENGRAMTKQVKVGVSMEDRVEVLSGLIKGEQVVTAGQINLKEGNIVNIINK
ncbi:efflux RND transporter periplasmic adaptor subunit [Olivibacter jilunii]|uniref:efflux RND transporter periplasmic adaptor subunit n=1 Tax=Olivibacter jilunii TaxID=985016 RepID=UPI00102FE8A8|nr:efflux RND transporter periplasmic adaptor subunit [Olivibacter jilunii]